MGHVQLVSARSNVVAPGTGDGTLNVLAVFLLVFADLLVAPADPLRIARTDKICLTVS